MACVVDKTGRLENTYLERLSQDFPLYKLRHPRPLQLLHTRVLGDHHRHPPLLAHCLQQGGLCALHPQCIKARHTLAAAAAAAWVACCRYMPSQPAGDLWLLLMLCDASLGIVLLLLGCDGQLLVCCTEHSCFVMPRVRRYVVQQQQSASSLQCKTAAYSCHCCFKHTTQAQPVTHTNVKPMT
jgi:hypothetical protein